MPPALTSLKKPIAFVDIETTGMRPNYDRIIEIGILRVEDNVLVRSYQSLVNPLTHLPPEITMMTGITAGDLDNAPTFRQIKDELEEILDGCIFVAHNVRFDYSFVKNEFKRLGIQFTPKHFCTAKLSRQLFPRYRHHNLDAIIERFGIECPTRHRAFDDANVLWEFFQKIQHMVDLEKLDQILKVNLKRPTIPTAISSKVIDSLPESSGVYIFYGQNGIPLYVGKSINIKERVMSHFSADHMSSKEMKLAQQVITIEAITTCGELGALLTESFLIKKMQPLYNRVLRHSSGLVVAKKNFDDQGYLKVSLDTQSINPEELESIIGIFKSVKQAKNHFTFLAKDHNLCDKLLGLENTKSDCFGYKLGRCQGACCRKEIPARYNLRFLEAIKRSLFRSWPFSGPIVVEEYDPMEEKSDRFLIDKWCYLKNLTTDESFFDDKDFRFDKDIYKILLRFLLKPKNGLKIKPVKEEKKPKNETMFEFDQIYPESLAN